MFQRAKQEKLSFLVPLDGSRLAASVLPTVERLATRLHAKVMLLHVMEQHAPTTIHGERHLTGVAEAQLYLEEIAIQLRSSGIPVETHVHEEKEDNVARSIVEHARESKIDLVMMCTHGRGGLRELLFGSIAQQALRRGTQPILLVFPGEDGKAPTLDLRRILVPLDGTAAHEPALPAAMTLARAFGAELHLVLVILTLATLSGSQAAAGLLLPATMRAVLDLAQHTRNNDHFSGLVQTYLRFVSSSHVILFTVFPHDKRVVTARMQRRTLTLFLFILVLAGCTIYIDWPNNPGLHIGWLGIHHPLAVKLGLDLQGGVQVLLEPDQAQHTDAETLTAEINAARDQIERRVSGGFGVSEPSVRVLTSNGQPRIIVELPGFTSGNQAEAINTLLKTGSLEFWNTGLAVQGVLSSGSQFNPEQFAKYNPDGKAQFTGKDLDPGQIGVGIEEQTGRPQINFAMKGDAVRRFGDFTRQNIGNILTVTLDREIIESATINSAITGQGVITGQFTNAEAQRIATVLRYGALPVALSIASQQTIGPTLGQDSIVKSQIAGAIGIGLVLLFMLLYYRLPGLLADLALLLYAAMTFALFKLIGVTLTLAGIAGFVLSIGMAVDANVLIFERVKEELRAGRLLASAIDLGWKRAWPSIRDSNITTMITCAVLYVFGNNFGASIIVGFATTLLLGVLVSMFTAIVVTRTFLNLLVPTGAVNHPALFGLPADAIVKTARVQHNNAE